MNFTQEQLDKLKKNKIEFKKFKSDLNKLISGDKKIASRPLTVGSTPYSLVICGADGSLPIVISKKTIDKARRTETRDSSGKMIGKQGHGLKVSEITKAIESLQSPVMILKGSNEHSLLVVTDEKDNQNRNIVVAVDLTAKVGFHSVNEITSTYGREKFEYFIGVSLKNGKLLAINIEKANKMLHSIEKSYLKENTFVSFDNSIAYSMENVKYPTQKNIFERREIMSIQDELMRRDTQDLLRRLYQYEQDKEEKTVAYIDLIGAYAFRDNSFLIANDETAFNAALNAAEKKLETYQQVRETVNPHREEMSGVDKAKQLIRTYVESEYGEGDYNYDDITDISLLYTTVTDNEIGLQVRANLENMTITYSLDDIYVFKTEKFDNIEDMNRFFDGVTFDDLYAEPSEEEIKKYERFQDFYSKNKPTVTVEWSEHHAFKDGQTYPLHEFNEKIRQLDKEWIAKREATLEKYGGYDAAFEAGESDYLGYAKVKFIVNNVPLDLEQGAELDTYIGRQDIGDGEGSMIDHIRIVANDDLIFLDHFSDEDRKRVEKSALIRRDIVVPYLQYAAERERRDAANLQNEKEQPKKKESTHGEDFTGKKQTISTVRSLIGDKQFYRSLKKDERGFINTSDTAALQLAKQLDKNGIKYSGIIEADKGKGTLTVHKKDIATCYKIAEQSGINLNKPKNTKVVEQEDGKKIVPSDKEKMVEVFREKLGAVLDSKNFKDFCKTKSLYFLHKYSFRNALLIYAQYPHATYVGSANVWQEYGRIVNAGEKSLKVFRPQFEHAENSSKFWTGIKNKAIADLNNNRSRGYGEARIGSTNYVVQTNNDGTLFSLSVGGKPIKKFETAESIKKWIDEYIIDKVPVSYGIAHVFDVSQTNDTPEYVYVKKGYDKSELVIGKNGEPIKDKSGRYKIRNSEERKARLVTSLDMTISPQDKRKMKKLYDVLVAVSKQNNCPITEKSISEDENLQSAYGYYSPDTHDITLRSDMELTKKVSVLIHEMAHSRMHNNLPKEVMQDKTKRWEIEIQAEATACMVASRFGIDTETASFDYIATYTAGRNLDYLEKSLDKIWKEVHKLSTAIDNELRGRGLTRQLEPNDKSLSQAERNEFIKDKKQLLELIISENKNGKQAAYDLIGQSKSDAEKKQLTDILSCRDKIDKLTDKIAEKLSKLGECEDKTAQDKLLSDIRSNLKKIDGFKDKISGLDKVYKDIEKADTWQKQFVADPIGFMQQLEAFNNVSPTTINIIAQSKFIRDNFSDTLNEKHGLVTFAKAAIEQAKNIESVMSKQHIAVEIVKSENWGNKTQFSAGMCMHPKLADAAIGRAETELRLAKIAAEQKGEYIPYSKTEYTIYSRSKDKGITALTATMEIGSGEQENLSDALGKVCQSGERGKILADFQESLKERGDATKSFAKAAEIHHAEEEYVASNMSIEDWKQQADAERDSGGVTEQEQEIINEAEKDGLPFNEARAEF